MANSDDGDAPVVIKKYANRRLYNTATSSYVTLDHLCQMVKDGVDFVVYDAKTGDDITRSVLTQIIFEEESKGQNLLPIGFLRQLISFYDDSLRAVLPSYLELSMQTFTRNQGEMRDHMKDTFGEALPLNQMQEWGKQNAALFQQAMSMFTPFAGTGTGAPSRPAARPKSSAPTRSDNGGDGDKDDGDNGDDAAIRALKRQLDDMQRQLQSLLHRGD